MFGPDARGWFCCLPLEPADRNWCVTPTGIPCVEDGTGWDAGGLVFDCHRTADRHITTVPTPLSGVNFANATTRAVWNDTAVTNFADATFSGLSQLEILHLRNCSLTVLPANPFNGLSSLEALGLGRNELTVLGAAILRTTSALRILDLGYNRLTIIPAPLLQHAVLLDQLYLHDNLLHSVPVNALSQQTRLTVLDLGRNRITAAVPLPRQLRLQDLRCDANRISRINSSDVIALGALRILRLQDNQITASMDTLLANLTRMEVIMIADNVIECFPNTIGGSRCATATGTILDREAPISCTGCSDASNLSFVEFSDTSLNYCGSFDLSEVWTETAVLADPIEVCPDQQCMAGSTVQIPGPNMSRSVMFVGYSVSADSISYRIAVTSSSSPGRFTVDPSTGHVIGVAENVGAGYTLELTAVEASGRTLSIYEVEFGVTERPVFVSNAAAPLTFVLAPQEGYATGVDLLVRLTVDETYRYRVAGNRSIASFVTGAIGTVTCRLDVNGSDARSSEILIDSSTGTFQASPSAQYTVQVQFVAVDSGGANREVTLRTWTFTALPSDLVNTTNGPAGQGCANEGRQVDSVRYDQIFTCNCTGTSYGGPNCVRPQDGVDPANGPNGRGCRNGLQVDPTDRYDGSFSCDCTGTDFAGLNCEQAPDVNNASSGPGGQGCVNGQPVEPVDPGDRFDYIFACDCSATDGFTGDNCEIPPVAAVVCEFGVPYPTGATATSCAANDCPAGCMCDVPIGINNYISVTCNAGAAIPTSVPRGTTVIDLSRITIAEPSQLSALVLDPEYNGTVRIPPLASSAPEDPDLSAASGGSSSTAGGGGQCPDDQTTGSWPALPLEICTSPADGGCRRCELGSYQTEDGAECRACDRGGFYSDRIGRVGRYSHCASACSACPDGMFAPFSNATDIRNCTVCPDGTTKTGTAGYRACSCLAGRARTDRFGPCGIECDAARGITCSNEYQELLPGYFWQFESDTARELYTQYTTNLQLEYSYDRATSAYTAGVVPQAYECPRPESCLGGIESNCAAGYAGPLCMVCAEGHVNSFGSCAECPAAGASVGLMLFFGSLLFTGLYYLWVRPVLKKDFASIKLTGVATVIFEDHYVVVGQLVTVYGFVGFSKVTEAFLTGIQYIVKPFSAAYGIGCLVTSVNALDELTLFLTLPFVVCGLVVVYYAVKRTRMSAGSLPDLTPARLKVNCIGILFKSFPTLLIYLLTKAVAVLRPCHDMGGSGYMFADYSVECDADYRAAQSMAIGALVLVVVLVGGTLIGMTMHVRRLKANAQEPTNGAPQVRRRPSLREASAASDAGVWSQAFVFLSEQYLDEFWYWRFVDFGRLVLLTSVIELIEPDTVMQLTVAIVFSFFFLQVYSVYSPFKSVGSGATGRNNMFYISALASIVLTLTFVVLVLSGFYHAKLQELGYVDAELDQDALHRFTDAGIIASVLLPYIVLVAERVRSRIRGQNVAVEAEEKPAVVFQNPMFEAGNDPKAGNGGGGGGGGYLDITSTTATRQGQASTRQRGLKPWQSVQNKASHGAEDTSCEI